jgi:replicative DNA helicase
MAEKGINCIFLNLEMSRNQILARSLARYAARKGLSISSVKLLRGYAWTEEQRKAITEAAEEYKQTIAPRMMYNPEGLSANLDDILQYLELETLKAEAAGKAAPCVVLDYLQIIRGRDHEDSAEIIKRAVQGLKDFAIRHNTVVFLIIAHNRESNKSGTITMESGRDTSAIEYSGDTQIGLTFTRCLKGWKDEKGLKHDKGKSPDELTKEDRKWLTLKIVKSRFGEPGRTVDLRFDGETMTYTQLYKDFDPVDVETPFDDMDIVVARK